MKGAIIAALAAVGLLYVATAVTSYAVLQLETEKAALARDAEREQRLQIALWRLDSHLAPILASEQANTVHDPAPSHEGIITRFFEGPATIFQDGPAGPAKPDLRDWLKNVNWASEQNKESQIVARIQTNTLDTPMQNDAQQVKQQVDFSNRASNYQTSIQQAQVLKNAVDPQQPVDFITHHLVRDDVMVVARQERGQRAGTIFDLDALRSNLLPLINDLLPDASIAPSSASDADNRLATLPLHIIPGNALPDFHVSDSGHGTLLIVTWIAVIVASIALVTMFLVTQRTAQRRAIFVSALTHELRTPVTSMRLISELLSKDMVSDPERRSEHLHRLHQESSRLGTLIDNVLMLSRLEQHGSSEQSEDFDCVALINGALPRLQNRCQQADLKLQVEETDQAIQAHGNRTAVNHVLENLIDNACKYAADGKRIEVTVRSEQQRVIISIRDFGPGLDVQAQKHAFQAFSRSAEAAAGQAPGVGLGLALSRRWLRQHGGDLRICPVDQGVQFDMVLRSPQSR